jgi:hypothetical protein
MEGLQLSYEEAKDVLQKYGSVKSALDALGK